MPCNCNNADPLCESCAICTPPGVTNLTTCEPVDICDGETADIQCLIYTGIDFPEFGVSTGDTIISVMAAILHQFYCDDCGTTTTTTTIAPSTTTTTTTTVPCECYSIHNNGGPLSPSHYYSYTDCEGIFVEDYLSPGDTLYFCAQIGSVFTIDPLTIYGDCSDIGSPCTLTTTTTSAPDCTYYEITSDNDFSIQIEYLPCNCDLPVLISISMETIVICANTAFGLNYVGTLTVVDLGPCNTPAPPECMSTSTTTTTTTIAPSTTTTTTSTETTSTTTTTVPPCECYAVINATPLTRHFTWVTCDGSDAEGVVLSGEIFYICAYIDTIIAAGLLVVDQGLCEDSEICNTTTTTTTEPTTTTTTTIEPVTTTTTTISCICYSVENEEITDVSIDFYDCNGDFQHWVIIPGDISQFCATEGLVWTSGTLTTIGTCDGNCTTTTTTVLPTTTTTTTAAPLTENCIDVTKYTETVGTEIWIKATASLPVASLLFIDYAFTTTDGFAVTRVYTGTMQIALAATIGLVKVTYITGPGSTEAFDGGSLLITAIAPASDLTYDYIYCPV